MSTTGSPNLQIPSCPLPPNGHQCPRLPLSDNPPASQPPFHPHSDAPQRERHNLEEHRNGHEIKRGMALPAQLRKPRWGLDAAVVADRRRARGRRDRIRARAVRPAAGPGPDCVAGISGAGGGGVDVGAVGSRDDGGDEAEGRQG